jgi:hypothetical protein
LRTHAPDDGSASSPVSDGLVEIEAVAIARPPNADRVPGQAHSCSKSGRSRSATTK